MAKAGEQPTLRVEGKDDQHALIHLLIRHGIDRDSMPAEYPTIAIDEGKNGVLDSIEVSVKTHSGRAVGFVLDADSPIGARWMAVVDRLKKVDVTMPSSPPPEGFVGESIRYRSKVGVWLMPDNQLDGKLETFLQTLIDDADPLIGHATQATDRAKEIGAEFSEPDRIKAVIHSWLAWQEDPGKPYGTAICARFFKHDSPAANAFVKWFRKLFDIS